MSSGEAAFVKRLIRARQMRSLFLPAHLFADPSYDILFELYSASLDEEVRTLTEVSIATMTPDTTTLRHLDALVAEGLVKSERDTMDRRRRALHLTIAGRARMGAFVASLQRHFDPAYHRPPPQPAGPKLSRSSRWRVRVHERVAKVRGTIMFDEIDMQYFAERALMCRNKEAAATDISVRGIHRAMAEEYERRAQGEQPRIIVRD